MATQWVRREHSKADIDRAGATLLSWWKGEADDDAPGLDEAFGVVENWRTCHSYPLNAFQVMLRKRARRIEPGALIAQRLKRFVSVMNKLAREPNMKLSQMQDLGGCRAIMSSVRAVDEVAAVYCGQGLPLFPDESTVKVYDYIRHPKNDGYRGIHVVGRFSARKEARQDWNGQRIEIQLRTRLQHSFATAVETVTTFTQTPLKSGGGPDEWRRFFSLVGSALALQEGTPLLENTPHSPRELIRELRDVSRLLRVARRLREWSDAVSAIPRRHVKNAKWLLMVLDLTRNKVSVVGYSSRLKAVSDLRRIERRPGIGERLDAVLVWVPDARHLRAAYPNYYADTREFLRALDHVLTHARWYR